VFSNNPPRRRIEWIDVARGIGIILVVYGHVLRGLISASAIDRANPFWASDYAIYTFHMPLFFLLAGLNVERSMGKGRKAFLTGKLWTLAYPYLLWSVLQGSIQFLIPTYVNAPRPLWTLATILWRPIAQFWFLYALFFCHLFAWACAARRSTMALLALLAMIAGRFLPDSIWNSIAYALPFYVAGLLLSPRILRWNPERKTALLWTAGSAALYALSVHLGRGPSHGNSSLPASWPAALAGIALTIGASHLIVDLAPSPQSSPAAAPRKIFEFLGAASLTIYILHVLVASGTRIALKRLHAGWPTELLLATLLGILVPAALHLLFDRLNLLPLLGLAPPPRGRNPKLPAHATELGA
jgi:fucose 4-O-acetylase-like acetyltransferase